MPQPIITLATGFGTADHFVGTMKSVILGIAPKAEIVEFPRYRRGGIVIEVETRHFNYKFTSPGFTDLHLSLVSRDGRIQTLLACGFFLPISVGLRTVR